MNRVRADKLKLPWVIDPVTGQSIELAFSAEQLSAGSISADSISTVTVSGWDLSTDPISTWELSLDSISSDMFDVDINKGQLIRADLEGSILKQIIRDIEGSYEK